MTNLGNKALRIYFNLLSAENDKVLGPAHHELGELVAQQLLDLICLLDGN